ncbi:MAG: phytanoyl-CoA dioxygenase family protein [Bacteroidota bacterium]
MFKLPNSVGPFFDVAEFDLATFVRYCAEETERSEYSHAAGVEKKVVIYDGRYLAAKGHDDYEILGELHTCLADGPGVLVIRDAYADTSLIDEVTAVFFEIIEAEKAEQRVAADHFGQNERIWNALQKVCVRAPALFVPYYGNPAIALIARAWLGPGYQMTAQVNNVKPGSEAQAPHRDYHLGFQRAATIAQYPARVQRMSQLLTLQGAIAHTDMPLLAGPTQFMPHSHKYPGGYLAFKEADFVAYFKQHAIQLPLSKGDMVFFSPALYHGAGNNRSDADRLANLLQISSAFGRPMESVNRFAMLEAVYPHLLSHASQMTSLERVNAIAAVADSYAFPTNLDTDPPLGGNAPESAADFVGRALDERWPWVTLREHFLDYDGRRQA